MNGLDINVVGMKLWNQMTEFDLAVTDQLKYLGIFGGSMGRSMRNLVPGDADDIVPIGSPVINAFSIDLKTATDYAPIGIGGGAVETYMAITQVIDTLVDNSTAPIIFGSSGANGTAGNIYSNSGSPNIRANFAGTASGASSTTTLNASDVSTDPICVFADCTLTDAGLYIPTKGVAQRLNHASGYVRTPAASISLGGNPGNSHVGRTRLFAAAYWRKALSTAERAAVYAQMKALFASMGVTI